MKKKKTMHVLFVVDAKIDDEMSITQMKIFLT